MKRIAIVSDSIFPYHKGGKELRLYEISKRLVNADTEVHIYTMRWWEGPRTIIREGVHYHALCRLYPLYTSSGRRSIVEAIMFGLATFKMLFERFDVIDVDHMPFYPLFSARIITWLRGKKLYATWHEVWGKDYWQTYTKGFVGFVGHITEWASFMLPDVIIANSTHTAERLHQVGHLARIVTVSLGVDTEAIRSTVPSSQTSDIIYVGRFLSHKNIPMLIDAVAKISKTRPDVSLLIVGRGPEEERIKAHIAASGIASSIVLRTDVDTDAEKYALIRASRMLVLPSEREGFGLVLVEGNAAGVPVITVDCPTNASRELVHDGINGLVAALSSESIAKKIEYIFDNHESFDPMRFIVDYDWKAAADKISRTLCPRPVVTTSWDDGHVLDLKLADLLTKYGIKGTFYVSPQCHELAEKDRLTHGQIKTLSHNFEIGAHTMTHRSLPALEPTEAQKEIYDSKTHIEKVTGRTITSFCYPRGEYTKTHVSFVHSAGFTLARTVKRFVTEIGSDPLQMPTSIHAYDHWSDVWGVMKVVHFNPVRFFYLYHRWDRQAIALFDKVLVEGGVFHLWGHSWEIDKNGDWDRLEAVLHYLSGKREVSYVTNNQSI